MSIGENIRRFRIKKGWRQQELAEALGVKTPAVSGWERGSYVPRDTKLAAIAEALGVDVDELTEDAEANVRRTPKPELDLDYDAREERNLETVTHMIRYLQTDTLRTLREYIDALIKVRECEDMLHKKREP